MANETGLETGWVGKIKRLVSRKVPQPSVVPAPQPKEPTVTQRKEMPVRLSLFQQLEQLLARESGITDPERNNREVKMEKLVRNPEYNDDRGVPYEDPAYITVRQRSSRPVGTAERSWGTTIEASVFVASADDLKERSRKRGWSGGSLNEIKNLEGSLLLSDEEVRVDDKHDNSIWTIMRFGRKPEIFSAKNSALSNKPRTVWRYDESNRSYPWSTTDAGALERVAIFLTEGDTAHSPPKVTNKKAY